MRSYRRAVDSNAMTRFGYAESSWYLREYLEPMIVETIFSTVDNNGIPNFAPMGLVWGAEFVTVRPFRATRTCRNMLSTHYGVANISDDVLAYVRCALYDSTLPNLPAKVVPGVVFENACAWREVEIVSEGGTEERAELKCRVLHDGRRKDFLGFRRASNAVIEATILATRRMLYEPAMLETMLTHYRAIVEKTGDGTDREAFQMVDDFVRKGAE